MANRSQPLAPDSSNGHSLFALAGSSLCELVPPNLTLTVSTRGLASRYKARQRWTVVLEDRTPLRDQTGDNDTGGTAEDPPILAQRSDLYATNLCGNTEHFGGLDS